MTADRRTPVVDLTRIGEGEGPSPAGMCFWLILLGWPISNVIGYPAGRALVAAGVLAVVVGLYVATLRAAFSSRSPMRVPVALAFVLTAVTAVAVATFEHGWFMLFPLLGVAWGSVLGHHVTRRSEAVLLGTVISLAGLAAVIAWIDGQGFGDIFTTWYGTATSLLVTAMMLRLMAVIGALRATREELARTAVEQERLRFSRDLHDLLGHTLSLMVVKAQAVRRIVDQNPAVAAEQAADIETVGRQALMEVREAVTGYRGRGLVAELDAARTALTDSAIEPVVRRDGPPLPPEADALLGWVVREGITNVIRHSGARRCVIHVRHEPGTATVEIDDDGRGAAAPGPAGPGGHGLNGLTERLAAAAGALSAGPHAGGFRLSATVPTGPDGPGGPTGPAASSYRPVAPSAPAATPPGASVRSPSPR